MNSIVARTRSRVVAEALVNALDARYTDTPFYIIRDHIDPANEGILYVQMGGAENTIMLDLVREFASGFLLSADGTSETQGYEPNQTPMSVSSAWKSDGTGFRD